MAASVLVADCIAKSFRGKRVLSAASLRAVPGELRALFGRNGSGKSTLLKVAVGWTPPDGGTVFMFGEPLARAKLPELATRGLSYMPDEGLLAPDVSVRRQLEFMAAQFPGGDVAGSADRMRMTELLDRRPLTLSGGERRRADLAAVLVRRPRCLIADEPYRGVAPLDAELLTAVFRDLAAGGCAVVATGHEVPTLLAAADHITWCTDGTTYELGTPADAQRHDRFRRDYLGAAFGSPVAR